MQNYEDKTGGSVMAIPHNGNLSSGMMFALQDDFAEGAPLVARWHKQFVQRLTPQPAPLSEAEINANFDYFNTEDYRIGYDAFINRQKPRFTGR